MYLTCRQYVYALYNVYSYVSSAEDSKYVPVCVPYSQTILNLSCKNFSFKMKVETCFKELAEIQGQSTLCITSSVGIMNCPVRHCQAATATVGSSQSPESKSGYSTTRAVAIPVSFGFIYSQSVATEPPDYSSLWSLQSCVLQFPNPSPSRSRLPQLCSAGATLMDCGQEVKFKHCCSSQI